jgi:hypothetical protein
LLPFALHGRLGLADLVGEVLGGIAGSGGRTRTAVSLCAAFVAEFCCGAEFRATAAARALERRSAFLAELCAWPVLVIAARASHVIKSYPRAVVLPASAHRFLRKA